MENKVMNGILRNCASEPVTLVAPLKVFTRAAYVTWADQNSLGTSKAYFKLSPGRVTRASVCVLKILRKKWWDCESYIWPFKKHSKW